MILSHELQRTSPSDCKAIKRREITLAILIEYSYVFRSYLSLLGSFQNIM